ncbi:MAG: ATP-binding cassette domain-containing protein [Ardenticatenia bacterium]|nr:ATP-binding cassette domain-containing protein [Ardenticatenia bacterium]
MGDDVAFGPRQLGFSREEVRALVREAMEAVGLPFEQFKDRFTFALSGGEQRRVALAGVLALRPEILILDEPLAGLDPAGRRHLIALLRRLRAERGVTLVLVSHDVDDLIHLVDRCVIVADGRTVMAGTPRELFVHPPARLAEFGLRPPAVVTAMHALADRGIPVRRNCLTVDEAADELVRLLGEE